MMRRSRRARYVTAAMLGSVLAGPAFHTYAQSYPGKPVRVMVGFPPGGGGDIVARMLAPKLAQQLGQPVVVENRSGAASNIALESLARANPDGYALILTTQAVAVNPWIYRNVSYDPLRDFAPITQLVSTAYVLVVHPSVPAKTPQQLLALAKSRPRQLLYSSGGAGNAAHLAAELYRSMARIEIEHVPYKGIAPGLVALLSGEVHLTFGSLASTLPYARSGRLRALAVTSARRSTFAQELPTLSEAGVPGYESTGWYGLLAPAATPRAVLATLHKETSKALGLPDLKAQLSEQGFEVTPSTPETFGEFLRSELAKWGQVVKTAGIKPE